MQPVEPLDDGEEEEGEGEKIGYAEGEMESRLG